MRIFSTRKWKREIAVLIIFTCFLLFSHISSWLQEKSFLHPNYVTEVYHHPVAPLEVNFSSLQPQQFSNEQIAAKIQSQYSNVPLVFWQKVKLQNLKMNETCARFPSIYDINYNNIYWQTLSATDAQYFLYNAYYDNRTLEQKRPLVRILGVIKAIKSEAKSTCQLWFHGHEKPVFSPIHQYNRIWFGTKEYNNIDKDPHAYLMSCKIPSEYSHLVPASVSLVENPCDDAKTNLRVLYNQPPTEDKEDFVVCVKGLNYPYTDVSVKFVEWLELLFLLGASKVIIYDLAVHPNVAKVLYYYKQLGQIDVTKHTLPGTLPNGEGLSFLFIKDNHIPPTWRNELIPLNDCFYKNMYKYKYIALLDIDEVIMPKSTLFWKELIHVVAEKAQQESQRHWSSFVARNVYFMDSMREERGWQEGIPKFLHMMQNVYRSSKYNKPGANVKSFHDSEIVLTLHNHLPLTCLDENCFVYAMETSDAHLQHYRNSCAPGLKNVCESEYRNHSELDPTILRYREPLVKNVVKALKDLGLLSSQEQSTSK